MSESVRSADRTVLGYELHGHGPALLLVHGGTADHHRWAPVLAALQAHYTVAAMDRRGRGLSDVEASPYSMARESEDIAAVARAIGPDVYLVAHSYGALCAVGALENSLDIRRAVLYEPPFPTPGHDVFKPGVLELVRAAAAEGDPERLLTTFYTEVLEAAPDAVARMRTTPMWQRRLAAAHTLVRESDEIEAYRQPSSLRGVRTPVRVLLGTESPSYYRPAAEALVGLLPDAELRSLVGQTHLAIDDDPDQFVTAVLSFDPQVPGELPTPSNFDR